MRYLKRNLNFIDEDYLDSEVDLFRDKCLHSLDLWERYEDSKIQLDHSEDLVDKMNTWICANARGKAYHGGGMDYYFELLDDMVAFKMVFG